MLTRRSDILIAVPTAIEAAPLQRAVGNRAVFLITGMGPAVSAHNITRFICTSHRPCLLILAGIAGAYSTSGLSPGQVCIASSECFGDIGRCSSEEIRHIELPDGSSSFRRFDLSPHYRKFLNRLQARFTSLEPVPMTTVSCSSGNFSRAEMIHAFTKADAENMEGASIALCCDAMNIPMIEIRGISNEAGDGDSSRWQIKAALENLSKVILSLVELASSDSINIEK